MCFQKMSERIILARFYEEHAAWQVSLLRLHVEIRETMPFILLAISISPHFQICCVLQEPYHSKTSGGLVQKVIRFPVVLLKMILYHANFHTALGMNIFLKS